MIFCRFSLRISYKQCRFSFQLTLNICQLHTDVEHVLLSLFQSETLYDIIIIK